MAGLGHPAHDVVGACHLLEPFLAQGAQGQVDLEQQSQQLPPARIELFLQVGVG